jgi:hypothetical protein
MTIGDGGHLECGLAPRTNSMPGGNLHAVEKSALKPERPARVRTPTLWQQLVLDDTPEPGPAVQSSMPAVSHSSPGVRILISSALEASAPHLHARLAPHACPAVSPGQEGEGGGVGGLDWEDSAGISAPLYDIVDVVFELGSAGR